MTAQEIRKSNLLSVSAFYAYSHYEALFLYVENENFVDFNIGLVMIAFIRKAVSACRPSCLYDC